MQKPVIINSRKFDGSIHRSWQCNLLEETSEYWVFAGLFEKEIHHPKLGEIRCGTISQEYYWKQKWFNVFRFQEPEGDFKLFYCNINMPPKFKNNTLDFIDLDLDVLVYKDFNYEILDLEEFEQNKQIFQYPVELKQNIQKSLDELLLIINQRRFPFDCKNS